MPLFQPGLVINHHADHTLSSFCQWQSGLMGKDGSRHDHAILLTGLDICSWKNEPCDTLGRVAFAFFLSSFPQETFQNVHVACPSIYVVYHVSWKEKKSYTAFNKRKNIIVLQL